ncbi:MAG: SGNH/GDSL hydrolase family protein [Verrucomicrobia bacterium]|nr:SGNH/GDSL hydrolase family protein [Verrucomicrobiota bacterium]
MILVLKAAPARFLCYVQRLLVFAIVLGLMTNYSSAAQPKRQIRYGVIGDSYSNGEGATPEQSWPALLTRHLQREGMDIKLVANPSVTGWTTQQAIDRELPIFRQAKPDFATLLIGVNDWVQRVSEPTFRRNIGYLMDQMLAELGPQRRLLVVTIPDFSVTPSGPEYARGRNIFKGLAAFNKIVAEESARRGLPVADIFGVSQRMRDDRSLVAADGLHPSAKAYAQWEEVIFPAARELLSK